MSMADYGALRPAFDRSSESFRVLVVERDEYAIRLLEEARTELRLTLDLAMNARQALRRLATGFYDAVVVNLPLARTSAEELYRVVARADRKQADRLVFLTPDLNEVATRRFLREAGRPFLTKPVAASELHDLVVRVAIGAAGHLPSWAEPDRPSRGPRDEV